MSRPKALKNKHIPPGILYVVPQRLGEFFAPPSHLDLTHHPAYLLVNLVVALASGTCRCSGGAENIFRVEVEVRCHPPSPPRKDFRKSPRVGRDIRVIRMPDRCRTRVETKIIPRLIVWWKTEKYRVPGKTRPDAATLQGRKKGPGPHKEGGPRWLPSYAWLTKITDKSLISVEPPHGT